jgi:hypothetical protein
MGVAWPDLRDWVLALPGGREIFVDNWGEWTLRYGGKVFVIGGPEQATASIKASREDQAELIDSAPDIYSPAPYVGRYGWVKVVLASADADELRQVVTEAWRRSAPKTVVREYDSAQGQQHQG